ncbi:phage shock protein E [Luminiphilus syltensis NOR5-1B]|uniref:Phage shock protein E n=1 Tax=Luminiphilus syltensis NOR5-1B TaxID=565045 RepID=B8KWN6_9GAMM|nr:phage shock protein E [Luminiphilus syltensis NOR5-1B]
MAFLLSACLSEGAEMASAVDAIKEGAALIDVRTAEEYAGGHIEHSTRIGHGAIVDGVAKLGLEKDDVIVVYCRSGNRSGKAKAALESEGYQHVINGGGYRSLQQGLGNG